VAPDTAVPATADAKSPPPDGVIILNIPDTRSPFDAVTSGPDGGLVTIQDIIESCRGNISSTVQAGVLACLAKLRESWSTGIAQDLAGANCATVSYDLSCFASSMDCVTTPSSVDYTSGAVLICKPIIIYAGVRFV
jgi:hypothetical protein